MRAFKQVAIERHGKKFQLNIGPIIHVVLWFNPEDEDCRLFHTVCNSKAEADAFVGQLEELGLYARIDIYHHEYFDGGL